MATVLAAFAAYQRDVVNAERQQVDRARERRDAFQDAFGAESDVAEVFCSGSLRRGTQLRPLHDVDMVVVYRDVDHPDWGQPGGSSEEAVRHVQSRVTALLGEGSGSYEQLVRITRASGRGRSVKCFIDTVDTVDTDDADAFTVDVMPVLRNADGTLLLPSQTDRQWSTADPEYLIAQVADRQGEWDRFRQTVRLLKLWAREQVRCQVKSLTTEVLALHHLPTNAGNVPEALRQFFTAAAATVSDGVTDPAGHCGPIQPDLNDVTLREALELAADHADKAVAAAARNDQASALAQWRAVLGSKFAPDAANSTSSSMVVPAGGATAVSRRPVRDAPQG